MNISSVMETIMYTGTIFGNMLGEVTQVKISRGRRYPVISKVRTSMGLYMTVV